MLSHYLKKQDHNALAKQHKIKTLRAKNDTHCLAYVDYSNSCTRAEREEDAILELANMLKKEIQI